MTKPTSEHLSEEMSDRVSQPLLDLMRERMSEVYATERITAG